MYGAGKKSLAGAGFTIEHNRGVASGNLFNDPENPRHRRALTDDLFESGFGMRIKGNDIVGI